MTDPHPRSNQPMIDPESGSVLSFNGEIYNYREIRAALQSLGVSFYTDSDTEVILKALINRGTEAIADFRGMYSFAFFNNLNSQLILSRDSLGKKPLYFVNDGKTLSWSSSQSSLRRLLPRLEINQHAIEQYLALGYLLNPDTVYQEINSVRPGQVIVFESPITSRSDFVRTTSIKSVGIRNDLENAIESRVRDHEKVALSLSGGVDSSIIAILLSQRARPFTAYSAVWIDSDKVKYNSDAQIAEKIANQLGVDFTPVRMIESFELPDELDKFVQVMEEPNNNPTGVSMLRLYESIAARGNRLVLTGDGSDEIFGGYPRHIAVNRVPHLVGLPRLITESFALNSRSRYSRLVQNIVMSQTKIGSPESWLHWHWLFNPAEISTLLGSPHLSKDIFNAIGGDINKLSPPLKSGKQVQQLMKRDLDIWIAMESNRKLDRVSMNYSIEARSPFQDEVVISSASELMSQHRHRALNKELLWKEFPELRQLGVRRDKAGFISPVGHWLRGNEIYFKSSIMQLKKSLNFDTNALSSLVDAPQSGNYKKIMQAWSLLVLSRWLETRKY
jgi:asparagine synthase (glutamine-hydrolysing)